VERVHPRSRIAAAELAGSLLTTTSCTHRPHCNMSIQPLVTFKAGQCELTVMLLLLCPNCDTC
jgi:hypothetical protein